jgi:hypothetical protein
MDEQCSFGLYSNKVKEPIPNNLSFKQLSMAFIETCLKNVWLLKIMSAIGPLSVTRASTLYCVEHWMTSVDLSNI